MIDGTQMPYPENSFALVYSISVIEHIFEKYTVALSEMIRVAKQGGYVYLTFPVSKEHQEEWTTSSIYSNQAVSENKTFFQYRFSEKDVTEILHHVASKTEIITQDIYWEKSDGIYNKIVQTKLSDSKGVAGFIRQCFFQMYYGFTLLKSAPESFGSASGLGVMHILLRKK